VAELSIFSPVFSSQRYRFAPEECDTLVDMGQEDCIVGVKRSKNAA